MIHSPVPTSVDGLDEVLRGGLVRGGFTLVQGDPGSGKTTLALQFILGRVAAGERCLYVTLTETRDDVAAACRSHGWSLGGLALLDLTRRDLAVGGPQSSVFDPADTELYAASAGGQVLIRVTDDGIGIPPDRIDRIFEMFNQVDSAIARSQGGLGIGLALVRRLVEMHDGTVTAESAGVDAGSTFTVRLPIGAAAERRLSAVPPPPARPAAGESVLVVDDNVNAADLLCQMLEQAGYSTVAAYDSESALAEVARRDHAIVILDIGLPGKNGYEVAREVRSMANRKDVALIALTGWGSAEDKRKARSAGFDVHLTKPIDPAVLQDVVADMARRRTERALDRRR